MKWTDFKVVWHANQHLLYFPVLVEFFGAASLQKREETIKPTQVTSVVVTEPLLWHCSLLLRGLDVSLALIMTSPHIQSHTLFTAWGAPRAVVASLVAGQDRTGPRGS